MSDVNQFQNRITRLQQIIDDLPDNLPENTDSMIGELVSTLEALSVAEEELRQQQESLEHTRDTLAIERQRYRDLFEFAPDAYIVTNLHGTIEDANATAVRLLNLETNFLVGKPLAVFCIPDERREFRSHLARVNRSLARSSFEMTVLPRHSAKPVPVAVTTSLLLDRAVTPVAIHWSLRDISERKHLEKRLVTFNAELERRVEERTYSLEQANHQKDDLLMREQTARAEAERANALRLKFLAMISHELRTPLTSIKGFASTLLANDVAWEPERWAMFVTIIDEEADKLTELVEQLLDLSRLQSGTLGITISPASLPDIVQSAGRSLQTLAAEHTLVIDLPEALPPVMADQRRIGQVIINLVSNASNYAPKGTIITVSARRANEFLEVLVSDQGAGIPPEERDRIFEAFYQITDLQAKRAGAGLGLAICKGLIERHGGHIWIEANEPLGTTFVFSLPVVS